MVDETAAALAKTHPAELDHVTYADLAHLIRSVGRLRRELIFVSQDVTRLVEYGKQIVYLLDFSELHAYLWPEDSYSQGQNRHVVNHLLIDSSLNFALPPGAVRELLRKLQSDLSRHEQKKASLDAILEKPFVQAFMKFGAASADPEGKPLESLVTQVIETLRSLRHTSGSLERLSGLYETGRLKDLSTFVEVSNLSPDLDVLQDAYIQLSAARLGREDTVNYIDAHNYALTFALNQRYYDSNDLFFLLVTSSLRPYEVFENIKWKDDPLFALEPDTIIRTSLVRHPVQLLYHSYLSQFGTDARKVITAATRTLLKLQETWTQVPGYKQYLSKKQVIPGSRTADLPQHASYKQLVRRFSETYHRLLRPLAEVLAVDSALEQNRRLVRGVSSAAVTGVYAVDEAQAMDTGRGDLPRMSADYRELLALYDRVVILGHREITKGKKTLAQFSKETVGDLDDTGTVVPAQELSVKKHHNPSLGCTEITVFFKNLGDQICFCADQYDKFTSFYWATSVDLLEFLKVARHFVKGVAAWVEEADVRGQTVAETKLYDGVYFFLDQGVKQFPLPRLDSLTADTLLSFCEPQWRVRFVRVGLPYGDLCYDFEPIGTLPQRAGIMTHLQCHGPISDFIQWTHSKYVQRGPLRRAVSDALGKSGR